MLFALLFVAATAARAAALCGPGQPMIGAGVHDCDFDKEAWYYLLYILEKIVLVNC